MEINTHYLKSIPDLDDIVYVKLADNGSSEKGFYMELLEYNNIQGFVLQTEVTRKKKDYRKAFKHDEIYACIVLNSTNKNGVISVDLSYKKIKEEDRPALKLKYIFMSKLNLFIHDLIKLNFWNSTELYEETFLKIIPNGKELQKIDIELEYNKILRNNSLLFSSDTKIPEDIRNKYLDYLKEHIIIYPVEMYKDIEFIVLDSDALNKIKEIFDVNTLIKNTTVEYLASPLYRISTIDNGNEKCNENINNLIEIIKERAKKFSTRINIDNPEVVIKEQFCSYKKMIDESKVIT
jgi:translation initiation factor 2 subunit 1